MNWIDFLAEVGAPIFGSLVMAFFIFLTLKYILEGVLDSVKSLTGIISMLEDRARVMNNDIVKIDALFSSAFNVEPNLDRIAASEGKEDCRDD